MLVRDASDRGWRVIKEPRVMNNQGQAFKPDVAFIKEGRVIVVDPTIKFEYGEDTLADGTQQKINYYQPVSAELKLALEVQHLTIRGLAVGARGGWTPSSGETLRQLGVPRYRWSHYATKAILSTMDLLEIHNRRGMSDLTQEPQLAGD